jgi:sulfatase modifying factor 1
MPVDVAWSEAARFTNWLNTSQGFPAAYKFHKQPGDRFYSARETNSLWVPGDDGFDPDNPFRNSQAKYFLPSADEWYKAAYYDPNANGGVGGYWDFPTGSDAEPTAVASGTDPGTAVYSQTIEQGPADVTQAGGLSP